MCVCVGSGGLITQSCVTHCDTIECSPQPPLFIGFPRQEYWSLYIYIYTYMYIYIKLCQQMSI